MPSGRQHGGQTRLKPCWIKQTGLLTFYYSLFYTTLCCTSTVGTYPPTPCPTPPWPHTTSGGTLLGVCWTFEEDSWWVAPL